MGEVLPTKRRRKAVGSILPTGPLSENPVRKRETESQKNFRNLRRKSRTLRVGGLSTRLPDTTSGRCTRRRRQQKIPRLISAYMHWLARCVAIVCEVSQASARFGLFVYVGTNTRAKPRCERSCRGVIRSGDQSRSTVFALSRSISKDCGTPWAFDRRNSRETLAVFR